MSKLDSLSFWFKMFLKIICLYFEAFYRLIIPPKRKDIRGEILLVTGAGHGIGRELALEFSRLGATLVLWDINKTNNENTAQEIRQQGGIAHAYSCDVTKPDVVHEVAEQVRSEVGDVTILVNNAGILHGGALLDLEEKDIQKTFDVNVLSQFWTVREFLPAMMEANYGYIMNLASASAKSGTAFLVDYSSSKFAVLGFTEAIAEEIERLGHDGIQLTAISPVVVDTGMTKYPLEDTGFNSVITPKETVLCAIDGFLRGESVVYVPRYLWLVFQLEALLPYKAVRLVKTFAGFGIKPQYKKTGLNTN